MYTTLPQNIINRQSSPNHVLWTAEVSNATSQNTVSIYATSIKQAIDLIDIFCIDVLAGSVILSIKKA